MFTLRALSALFLLLAVDGDESSTNVSGCSFWAESGVPETVMNAPYSNDGDTERWLAGTYEPLAFRRADVDARTVETRTLPPE
jgi:hypothetical protein